MSILYIIIASALITFILMQYSNSSIVQTYFSHHGKNKIMLYYYLPQSVLNVQFNCKILITYNEDMEIESCEVAESKISMTSEIIADTQNIFYLKYSPHLLMSDGIKFNLNAKGLLESTDISSEDKLVETVSKLSESSNQTSRNDLKINESEGNNEPLKKIYKLKEYSYNFISKAASINENKITCTIVVENELDLNKKPYILDASLVLSSDDIDMSSNNDQKLVSGLQKNVRSVAGILTRPIKNISVKFHLIVKGQIVTSLLIPSISIADTNKLIEISILRTVFAKRENKITFKDGMISSSEINNEASFVGFINIPISVLKALIAIPSQIVQFKFDNTKRAILYDAYLLNAKEMELKTQKSIEELKIEISKLNKTI